jgi:hypothetical protein
MTTNDIQINVTANTEQAQQGIKKLTDEVKKESDVVKETASSWGRMGQKIIAIHSAIGLFKEAVGALSAFNDIVKKMEGFQTQATALKLMSKSGDDLNNVLDRSVEITKGVVNQYDILGSVNQLMMKGFELSSTSLEKLIDVSAIYSSVTGQDVNSVMQMLAMASQRERDATFEKMGVYIDTDVVLQKYADTMGITIEQLGEAEKSTVLLENAMDKMKAKFEETGLSASSLESPITHALKAVETAFAQVTDYIVGKVAELYLWLIKKSEELLGWFDDEQTRAQMKKLDNDAEAAKKYSGLLAETEKLKQEMISGNDSATLEKQQDALLTKIGAERERMTMIYEMSGTIDEDSINNVIRLEKRVASLGSESTKAYEILKKEKKEAVEIAKIRDSIKFSDLPSEDKKTVNKSDSSLEDIKRIEAEAEAIRRRVRDFGQSNIDVAKNKIADIGRAIEQIDIDSKTAFAQAEKLLAEKALAEAELSKAEVAFKTELSKTEIAIEKEKQLEKQKAIKETYDIDNQLSQQKKDYEQKIREENKKAQDMDLKEKEKYFNMFQSIASQSIEEIFNPDGNDFKDSLKVFANSFGTTLIMDGVKTMLMGSAENALFPGLGSSAMAIGASEIAIGTAMKAGAVHFGVNDVINPSDKESSSATEKSQQGQPLILNVTTSLFGGPKQARKELNNLMRS